LVRRFSRGECEFGYRRSFFKTSEGRNFVITRAAFALNQRGPLNTQYKDVRDRLAAQNITAPTLAQVREAVIAIRRCKLPDLSRIGTAGSFFKNPLIPHAEYEALAARYPGLPGHDEGNSLVKVPLGWVLDKVCGLKGIRRGRVGTHSEQALVIVNEGGTAAEVERFATELVQAVKEKTGIDIEWEVEKVGW
jgi:UDP-N-acetylmuramate dehydrogenase